MKTLLPAMKVATHQARTSGQVQLPPVERADFVARYHALLACGLAANPPPDQARRPGQRGRLAQSPRAISSSASSCSRTRSSPSSTISPSPSITIKRSAIYADSRSSRKSLAVSAATGERTPTRRFAAISRPYASRASRSCLPSTPSSPVSRSIQPPPDLLRDFQTRNLDLYQREHASTAGESNSAARSAQLEARLERQR